MYVQRNKECVDESDDGFNGYGTKLLSLADEYDRFRRQFDSDARECLDSRGGLVGVFTQCLHAHIHTDTEANTCAMRASCSCYVALRPLCSQNISNLHCICPSLCVQNFDLMQQGSHMDMCAMLATLRDKELGAPLSAKPNKRHGAVKGIDDMIIHLPAMM